ncbi:MAG: hypothetical protein GY944_25800 [bacterium]|nr:hypothetical protein [bacterium]
MSIRFANLFLCAYALDALLSLLVLGVLPDSSISPMIVMQRLLASLVYLMVFVCLPLVAFSARLPMALFLALSTSVFWLASGAAPLPLIIAADEGLPVALASIQIVFAGLALLRVRSLNGGVGWMLRDDTLGDPTFSLLRPLRFAAVLVFVIAPLGVAYVFVSLGTWIEVETERFVSLDLEGVQLADRRYALEDRELRLVGMMHLGEDEVYRDITQSFVSENTIVLEEGVSDEDEVLADALSYERLADALGLTSQRSMSHYLSAGEGDDGGDVDWPVIRNADVDASAFEPETREVLAYAARVWSAEAPVSAFWSLYRYLLENPDDAKQFMHDIIALRNQHLLGEIAGALGHYERVIVPWGALHLPEVERHMLEQGFVLEAETRRRVVAWKTLFAAIR